MAIILDFSEKPSCPKCKGETTIELPYCEDASVNRGVVGCPGTLHHHMSCNRCDFKWIMMIQVIPGTGMEEFSEDVKCPGCGETDDTKFECRFCEVSHKGGPQSPHHHLSCTKCKRHWFMASAEIDIERSFDDLDQFVEACPKCKATNLDVDYADESGGKKCRAHSEMDIEGEHLHMKCGFCDFKWSSVTADFIEPKEEGAVAKEAMAVKEVKEAKPM
jgi:uncharacterized protein YbaR (Trm112 family)